jgi:hypothetical protein
MCVLWNAIEDSCPLDNTNEELRRLRCDGRLLALKEARSSRSNYLWPQGLR